MTISIFGNPIVEKDSVLVHLLPVLQQEFSQHVFIHQDPTENLTIPKEDWIILDAVQGLSDIHVFTSLDDFLAPTRDAGVHGYDLYTELKLLEKLNKLPNYKIIGVPMGWGEEKVLHGLKKVL